MKKLLKYFLISIGSIIIIGILYLLYVIIVIRYQSENILIAKFIDPNKKTEIAIHYVPSSATINPAFLVSIKEESTDKPRTLKIVGKYETVWYPPDSDSTAVDKYVYNASTGALVIENHDAFKGLEIINDSTLKLLLSYGIAPPDTFLVQLSSIPNHALKK